MRAHVYHVNTNTELVTKTFPSPHMYSDANANEQ